jgi:hypothetical protein
VQGDLEIRPRAGCAQCGRRVAAPVAPSFVYGIGAIGFQHCDACGARWRCMWEPPRRRRISLRTLLLVGVIALVLAAAVATYASSRSSEPELASTTRSSEAGPRTDGRESPAGERYREIVGPANEAKADLQGFLASIPPVTPRSEIDRRVAAYAAVARRANAALDDGPWPSSTRRAVRQLIAADLAYTGELARSAGGLNQPAISARLVAGAATVRAAANRVRTGLGLSLVPVPPDRRFAPL